MVVAFEAIVRFRSAVVIDSMGYAFTAPLFSIFSVFVSYVHYPTVSDDMLTRYAQRAQRALGARCVLMC